MKQENKLIVAIMQRAYEFTEEICNMEFERMPADIRPVILAYEKYVVELEQLCIALAANQNIKPNEIN